MFLHFLPIMRSKMSFCLLTIKSDYLQGAPFNLCCCTVLCCTVSAWHFILLHYVKPVLHYDIMSLSALKFDVKSLPLHLHTAHQQGSKVHRLVNAFDCRCIWSCWRAQCVLRSHFCARHALSCRRASSVMSSVQRRRGGWVQQGAHCKSGWPLASLLWGLYCFMYVLTHFHPSFTFTFLSFLHLGCGIFNK